MENILKEKKLKITKNRILILNFIDEKKYVTINDVMDNLNIDKSTIYRIIKILIEKDILSKLTYSNEEFYTLTQNHLHILKCVICHNQTEINTCPFDNGNYNDFIITKHSLIIEGICKNCQKNRTF